MHKEKTMNNKQFQFQKQKKQQEPQKKQEQSFWGSATTKIQSIYFNSVHMIDLALNDQKSNLIWMLGQKCKSNNDARIIYSSVLWFTYRKHLQFYKINKKFTKQSDVGWGCMIRVGQMMIANCLRLNNIQKFANQNFIKILLQDFIKPDGIFSVQNIALRAYQQYKLQPGQWYSPSKISYILRDIQNTKNSKSFLKVLVYDNQHFLEKSIYYLNQKLPKIQINNKNNDIKFSKQMKNQKTSIDPGLVIILIRAGINIIQAEQLKQILNLLKKNKNCIGILGGSNGKAHYIIGTTQTNFIYLDPHCVKETQDIDSFFCTSMFSTPHLKVNPSMALCFYVKNYAQLICLHDYFNSVKNLFYSYSHKQMPNMLQIQDPDSQFEQI